MAAHHGDAWPILITGGQPEIRQHGRRYRAVDDGYFDADVRLAQLDTIGIEVQVLSPLPVMLPQTADGAAARDWCAAYNEGLVTVCEAHPTRFRALGMLPLQAPGLALEEVARVKSLGLHGLEFGTRLGGQVELADPALAEVFAAAADAELPVLVHPNHGDTFGCDAPVIELGVGVGCETARAMALLHVAGTLDRCRGLRLCLSHGGGAYLWLWPRFGALAARNGASPELPACLHVDTAGLVGREPRLPGDRRAARPDPVRVGHARHAAS